jgi:hypothetical protein
LKGLVKKVSCVPDNLIHVIDFANQFLKDYIEHSDNAIIKGFGDIVERLQGSKPYFVFAIVEAVKDRIDDDE